MIAESICILLSVFIGPDGQLNDDFDLNQTELNAMHEAFEAFNCNLTQIQVSNDSTDLFSSSSRDSGDNLVSDSSQETNGQGDNGKEETTDEYRHRDQSNDESSDDKQDSNNEDLPSCDEGRKNGSCRDTRDYDECIVTPERCKDD